MTNSREIFSKHLLQELQACTQLRYSGKLVIRSSQGDCFSFYYRFGRIIWATGGLHPSRRWHRQITKYCADIDMSMVKIRAADLALEHWDYQSIVALHRRNKVESKSVEVIAENVIQEILFDLGQDKESRNLSYIRDTQIILDLPITFTSTNLFIKRTENQLQTWLDGGFVSISPNFAPRIKQPEHLQTIVSPAVYKNFTTFINGKYTLRDLSILLKQDVHKVTTSLQPHIAKGLIQLVKVPDLPLPGSILSEKSEYLKPEKPKRPLIACIDDSSQVCQLIEQIILANGMNCLKIQDAIQALPKLIEHKPDLILLDLIMPVANGYEICSQIRRITEFANTPIIIITGSDGMFNRARAKVAGSTDFMTKPISSEQLTAMVRKYLPQFVSEPAPEMETVAS